MDKKVEVKKEDKKEKEYMCFPSVEEYEDMSIRRLMKLKKQLETVLNYIIEIIRKRVQK